MRIRGPLVALAGLAALAAWWALSRPAPDPESARGGAASLGRAGDDASAQRAGPELAVPPSAAEAGERSRTSVEGTLVLAGRVVFGDGRAAYSAPMTLRAERAPTIEVRAVSGVDGTFRIARSERGPYTLYAEKARGSIVASAGEIVCRTELAEIVAPTLDLRVELAAPFELRGRVLDAFGAPLPEARLCAVPLGPDGAPSSSPSVAHLRSPEGVFSLILPHGGAWRIGALAGCRVPAQECEFQVSGLHTGLELVCGVPATVLGRVLDVFGGAPGEPEWIVRDTEELALVPCWPALDARVGTKHGPLLPGDYELVARAGGRELSQRFSVRAGETTQVELRFE